MIFKIELSEKQIELLDDLIHKEINDLIDYQDNLSICKNDADTQYNDLLKDLKFKLDTYYYIQNIFVVKPAIEHLKNAFKKDISTIENISNSI